MKPTSKLKKAFTAKYYALGMNGTYFNNYYAPTQVQFGKDIDRETSIEGLRTFVVTHQDICPIGRAPYKPLPMNLGASQGGRGFDINIGTVKEGEYLYLTVGYDRNNGKDVDVTLRGNKPVPVTEIPVIFDKITGYYYDDYYSLKEADTLLRYSFEGISGEGDLTIHYSSTEDDCNVVYIELTATPKPFE